MKYLKWIFKKPIILITVVVFGYSCSDDNTVNEEVSLTQSDLKAVLEIDEITNGVDLALFNLNTNAESTGKSYSFDCYSAVYSETGYVATFNNCVLNGTENVNGELTVTYNLEDQSGSFTVSYDDFYIGDVKINGSRSFAFTSNIDSSAITFAVTSDMIAEMEDGSIISDNGVRATTLIFGEVTTTSSITGNWTVQYKGNTYNVTVNNALTSAIICSYVSGGDMDLTKNGLTVNVDFGDSTCDDIAMLTYPNGVVEEITLED
ncbi:hypothetical protein [Maribacter sp. Asnod1-A12]|uniref:hypothetical protein n=1 Tax=Maribacter sp. Asnod1-A12 TaxID=3160576 RepID=UPI0038685ED9